MLSSYLSILERWAVFQLLCSWWHNFWFDHVVLHYLRRMHLVCLSSQEKGARRRSSTAKLHRRRSYRNKYITERPTQPGTGSTVLWKTLHTLPPTSVWKATDNHSSTVLQHWNNYGGWTTSPLHWSTTGKFWGSTCTFILLWRCNIWKTSQGTFEFFLIIEFRSRCLKINTFN